MKSINSTNRLFNSISNLNKTLQTLLVFFILISIVKFAYCNLNFTFRNARSSQKLDNIYSYNQNYIPYSEIKKRIEIFPVKSNNKNELKYQELETVYDKQDDNDQTEDLNLKEITDFKEILVDSKNEVFFVGAKNYLIKFSYKNDKLKITNPKNDIYEWKSNEDLINECKRVTKDRYCHNFIKVLAFDSSDQSNNDKQRLLVCGTNAYKPLCSWRSKTKLSEAIDLLDGHGKSPRTPDLSSLYLGLSNGDFYFATSIDHSDLGMKPDYLIERSIGQSKQIRTDQYNSNWLNDPVFVASITIGDYVYFFIRETAIEYMNCGEKIYSRVVRICKYDQGLENYDIWKTFQKARINCSIPSGHRSEFNSYANNYHSYESEQEHSFYFDEIQDVYYDSKKGLIYGIFSTPMNGMKGSAICVYDVNSLENAFKGPFKHQKSQDSIWEPYDQEVETAKCEPASKSSKTVNKSKYIDAQKFQLKHQSIQPLYEKPIIVLPNKRLIKLLVDNVITKQMSEVNVLFAATEYNTILKYTIINTDKLKIPNVCLLEETEILDKSKQEFYNSINNLVLIENLNAHKHLLIATSFNLVKIQLSNCEAQTNYFSCLSSMDPYCIWDSKAQKCLFIFKANETLNKDNSHLSISNSIRLNNNLHQHTINSCPSTKIPVDGGFSEWSQWSSCLTKSGQKCKCRMRLCNNPEPRNGGKNCDENLLIEILDCEVNGGWTQWSEWSSCKLNSPANCELNSQLNPTPAIRTRTRTCTNPEPRFNGRLCVGPDQEEELCTPEMINPCHSLFTNQWSSWGAWEECSKTCGEGFQMRRRICNSKNCIGCNQEWKTCNSHPCPERKENLISEWDTIDINKESGHKLQKRLKFTCKYENDIDSTNSDLLSLNSTTEFRICEEEKNCKALKSVKDLGDWTEWSVWSACKDCGDEQTRTRKCNSDKPCFGHEKEFRECACSARQGESGWSCWSDFTACSVKCGKGVQKRTRVCLNTNLNCDGSNEDMTTCFNSNCSETNFNDKLIHQITSFPLNNNMVFNLIHVIIACIVTFLLGSLLVLMIVYLNLRSKNGDNNGLFCCCCKSKKKKTNILGNNLCSALDHNTSGSDTPATTETNDNTKYSSSSGSDSSSNSASSSHSKEYFTIGNRFDPTGISSLLNDVIPDDDDEDVLNIPLNTGTLNRNNIKNLNKLNQKHNTLGLPNKSFNAYVNHKDLNKNSNNSSGLLNGNVNIINNNSSNNNNTGTLRFSNFSNLHPNGSLRLNAKNQRTSFAFPMRTNLDQEL